MHQSIAQRRAVLQALRQRCELSTAEFYAKTNRLAPVNMPRYSVIPNGNNEFGIVERSTGLIQQVCRGHGAACRAAQQLEAAPERLPTFASRMLNWTCAIAVTLGLFAAYGTGR